MSPGGRAAAVASWIDFGVVMLRVAGEAPAAQGREGPRRAGARGTVPGRHPGHPRPEGAHGRHGVRPVVRERPEPGESARQWQLEPAFLSFSDGVTVPVSCVCRS